MRFKRIFLLLGVMMLGLSLLSAEPDRPKYVISGDYNYPPFEFLDDNQQPAGYNVELSKAIGDILGFDFEFRLMKWSQARASLESGEVDLLQGMALSAERAKHFHFSIPHTQTWRSIFVARNSPVKKLEDIVDATLVMQQGDVSQEFLSVIGFRGQVVESPTQVDALRLLNRGLYDATIINHVHGIYLMNKYHFMNITTLSDQVQSRDYCYASKDESLIARINDALLQMGRNGQLKRLHQKWFAHYRPKLGPSTFFDAQHLKWTIPILLLLAVLIGYALHARKKLRDHNQKLREQVKQCDQREEEIRRERDLFRFGPVVIYKLQVDPLRMMYISPNVEQFGYSPQEVLAMDNAMLSLVHPDDLQEMLASLAKQDKDNPSPSEQCYRIMCKNGNYLWVFDYSLYQLDSAGTLISYGYLLDYSKSKAMEDDLVDAKLKVEEASTVRGQFLANMSHEIRTPLNGILALINLLKEYDMSPQQEEIFELIEASGKSLNGLIRDILDLSKIESGQLQKVFYSFNPRFLAEELVNTYAKQRERSGVDIRLQLSDDLPKLLWGDQYRTSQILSNLMQNAIKFTSEGWVQLSASLYGQTDDTAKILFSVKDTGIGIPAQSHEKIFDLYYQGNHACKDRMGGTGLGLSIVKRLVSLLGGTIWLESEVGKGSNFSMIIPYAFKLTDSGGTDHLQTGDYAQTPLPPLRVLIVENDPVSRRIISSQLVSWGLEVDLAENGRVAVDKTASNPYDFILMDLQIQELDGVTAASTILEHKSGFGSKPYICAVSASALPGEKERCLQAGMDNYITKPINLRALHGILTDVAESRFPKE